MNAKLIGVSISAMLRATHNPASIPDAPDPAAEEQAWIEGEDDIAAGRVISHDAMRRWLLSWGSPDELPPPECGE